MTLTFSLTVTDDQGASATDEVLVTVLDPRHGEAFGRYLRRKFPEYDDFYVMQVVFPSNIRYPGMKKSVLAYAC